MILFFLSVYISIFGVLAFEEIVPWHLIKNDLSLKINHPFWYGFLIAIMEVIQGTAIVLFIVSSAVLLFGMIYICMLKLDAKKYIGLVYTCLFTLISIIFAYIKNNYEKKSTYTQQIHREINWSEKVYNLEIKNCMTIKDLIILNSLINPYSKYGLDLIINKIIVLIVIRHLNSDSQYNSEILTKITNCFKNGFIDNNFIKDNQQELSKIKGTIFNYDLSKIQTQHLNSQETQFIRECTHLLLKNDPKL